MDQPGTSQEENKQNNNSKLIIITLAILLAALAFFAYKNYYNNQASEQKLIEEKLEIQSDLNKKIAELDTAIAENSTMTVELTEARNVIVAFRDSVKNLKSLNYRIIRRYKNKLAVLETSNKKLLHVSDSLVNANYNISIERDSAQATVVRQASTIEVKIKANDSLSLQNVDLIEKVSLGAALQISNVSAIAMKERSGGKLKETSRAKSVDAFRISFKIRENAITESGLKKAHIVIQNTAGKVLSSSGEFTDTTGMNITYSDVTDVDYTNKDIEVIIVSDITETDLEKGDYYVKVYLENKLLGTSKIYLK